MLQLIAQSADSEETTLDKPYRWRPQRDLAGPIRHQRSDDKRSPNQL